MASVFSACGNIRRELTDISLMNTVLGTDAQYDAIHDAVKEELSTLNWEADMINDMAGDLATHWKGIDYYVSFDEVLYRVKQIMREYG